MLRITCVCMDFGCHSGISSGEGRLDGRDTDAPHRLSFAENGTVSSLYVEYVQPFG